MPKGIIENTDIELNVLSGEHWNRATIADGKWLNKNTIQPLYNNDCTLASAIHDASADLYSRLEDASAYLDAYITDTSADLYNRLETASGFLQDELVDTSGKLQYEIDTINAGADVIDVLGSYQQLMEYSGWTTNNDVIKVLNDESPEHSGYQTYWRYWDENLSSAGTWDPDPDKWNYVGALDPYYSRAEMDEIISRIDTDLENASAYTTLVSGSLFQKIDNTSAYLHGEIVSSATILNQYIGNVSGDLYERIEESSGFLMGELANKQDILTASAGIVIDSNNVISSVICRLTFDEGRMSISHDTYLKMVEYVSNNNPVVFFSRSATFRFKNGDSGGYRFTSDRYEMLVSNYLVDGGHQVTLTPLTLPLTPTGDESTPIYIDQYGAPQETTDITPFKIIKIQFTPGEVQSGTTIVDPVLTPDSSETYTDVNDLIATKKGNVIIKLYKVDRSSERTFYLSSYSGNSVNSYYIFSNSDNTAYIILSQTQGWGYYGPLDVFYPLNRQVTVVSPPDNVVTSLSFRPGIDYTYRQAIMDPTPTSINVTLSPGDYILKYYTRLIIIPVGNVGHKCVDIYLNYTDDSGTTRTIRCMLNTASDEYEFLFLTDNRKMMLLYVNGPYSPYPDIPTT